MENQEINDVAKEVVAVLNYVEVAIRYKIPDIFLNHLYQLAKSSTKEVKIDTEKKISEQNISEESKDLISLIYYSYIATEEEKIQLQKKWNENDKKYYNDLQEKYSIDTLFKK